ncbi:MAG: cation-translocating P-type ATPase [Methanosphaera sp.]|nr:cation-translocating P-type ATPase [Methanosphaera sp.]
MDTNNENKCYDPDCSKECCDDPQHFNYICMDPSCVNVHCENHSHYDKQLLKNYQESTDLSKFNHKNNIIDNTQGDIKICSCDDCNDEEDEHKHNHSHSHEHNHSHSHEHHHDEESCHEGECCCDEDSNDIKICNCDDCDDDDDEEPVIADGKPLLANRSVQIIVSSGILFVLGHILERLSVNSMITTIVFMLGAIIAGYEIAIMGWKAITKKHTITPAVLMSIACIASFIIGHPEEGAAVTFLYYIAEFLEDYSELRAKKSIKSLVEIAPETARVKVENGEEKRKIDDVDIDEIVIVKPGDKVPLDGNVIYGSSTINQASITGESLPVTKNVGDKVFAGTVNQDGYLEVKVTKKAKDSVISKIVTLVKSSQINRSHTETYVEKIAKYYTPIIIIITACVAFIPPLLLGEDLVSWVYRALSIMVISCPCAFLISTPIGMVSSITSATRQGVLIKGSSYVEEMRNIKAVIFDKTGTLTEGKLEVADIHLISDDFDEHDIISIAASLETKSTHPIGEAILKYAQNNKIKYVEISDFKNIPGKGIRGNIEDVEYYVANESFIEDFDLTVPKEVMIDYQKDGKTAILVGNSTEVFGIITVMDKIRDGTTEVISSLNNLGIQTVMLTGDNKRAAKKVAERVGLKYFYSDLMPEDKLNILDTIRNKFGDVAMVGDGINDAPALARANIGIAMGAIGSDVAIDTSDVALMHDDLKKLPYLFALSQKTMTIIRQNIITAITVKILFVILAILGLITLMMSVGIGDMGLTMLVILNSFRIGLIKDPMN